MSNPTELPDLDRQFRKKPVVIEAIQWTGKLACLDAFNIPELHQSLGSDKVGIPTLEGTMIASIGDWIIKGVKGEFYPCKPDIFAATYEPAARRAQPEGEAPQADDVARKELLLALQAVLDTCATKSGAPKMSHLGTLAALNTAIDLATRAAQQAAAPGNSPEFEGIKTAPGTPEAPVQNEIGILQVWDMAHECWIDTNDDGYNAALDDDRRILWKRAAQLDGGQGEGGKA